MQRRFAGAPLRCLLSAAVFGLLAAPASAALTELKDIVALSAGGFHTCGITTTGGVRCWGSNGAGQLGDGTRFRRMLPVDVVGLGGPVTAISAGASHTCAVLASGGIKCWGSNAYGQLGVISIPEVTSHPTPVDALGLTSGIAGVAAGDYHTCAATTSGAVKCWGTQQDGLIGGTPDVPALASGVSSLAASGDFMAISPRFVYYYPSTCALAGGGVQCWGYNTKGQLGDGTTTSRPVPLLVTGLASGVQSIAMGGQTSCALLATGGVKCWGLGYGTTPADVPGLASGVAKISVGEYHGCAVTTGGAAKCWANVGVGDYGQVGPAAPGTGVPPDVAGLSSGVAAVGGGERHSCALLGSGGVQCWGNAYFDQIGNGVIAETQSAPTAVMSGIQPRLANIATRGPVQDGDSVLIGGFIVQGSSPKTVVVRARGPSLVPLGVANAMEDPALQLYSGQAVIAANDNWQTASNAPTLLASGFAPSDPRESAILTTLAPGAYTAIVSRAAGAPGVGIVEVFELDEPLNPLVNIATRGQVLTGENVMIAGFVIQGDAPQEVIVRARGPSLAEFGITNFLANPVLQLFSGQVVIASNDDWSDGSTASFTLFARGFAPADPRESAILITLNPGAYTAIVTGAGGTTGVGIVEVFAQ